MEATAKILAIKKAYGEHFKKLKPYINLEFGWVNTSEPNVFWKDITHDNFGFKDEEVELLSEYWRPKTLTGIHNNNGWTRIESEEDLPKDESMRYKVYLEEHNTDHGSPVRFKEGFFYDGDLCLFGVTHYKPIEPELLPIY